MALLREILVPLLAVNDTSLTVVELPFADGDRVKKGDVVMVLETSKTTYDIEAEEDGHIQYMCEVDRDYEVNAVIARIFSEAAEAVGPSLPSGQPAVSTTTVSRQAERPVQTQAGLRQFAAADQSQSWDGETVFSQQALQLMASAGLDPSRFKGLDLVTSQDVRQMLDGPLKVPAPGGPVKAPLPALPADPQKVILEKLSSAKKREIEYLSDVQNDGLTSTINIFVETEGIFTHINRAVKHLKGSLLPVILYESARLLTDYPLLNAYYTGNAIARYREINPGFAIDIDKGLKVLKVARAGELTIGAIEEVILRLSGAYIDETLQVEDMTDITFTITDLSSEGVAFFRPLVNKMNSSILGVSAIDEKLDRCTLSLTFDHRVTEGKLASRFLMELKGRLESYRVAGSSARLKEISCFKCFRTLKEDLGGTGFARVVTPEGKDGYICQTCLKGF